MLLADLRRRLDKQRGMSFDAYPIGLLDRRCQLYQERSQTLGG